MILEVYDIFEGRAATAHLACPEGAKLGEAFDSDPKLKDLAECVIQVTADGHPVPNWREFAPGGAQLVKIAIKPAGPIFAFLQVVMALFSLVQFFMGLFNQPKPRKAPTVSPTYTFEGIQGTIAPGEVVPVVYGRHRKSGQVLMYYVDVNTARNGQNMAMLLGMADSQVSCINQVEINDTGIDGFPTATWTAMLGLTSQAVITGFDRIKNTFFDGREVPLPTGQPSLSVVYTTNAMDTESVDLQLIAPDGIFAMRTVGKKAGQTRSTTLKYRVEIRQTNNSAPSAWTLVGDRGITGNTVNRVFDVFTINLRQTIIGNRAQADIRVTHLGLTRSSKAQDGERLVLQNITEYRDVIGAYSNTALLAVGAVATANLQGGRPKVTAVVHGRPVRVYSSNAVNINSFSTGFTQNPAWCVMDYMTNSVFGMGPYISAADVDLQSFVDFAVLANSRASNCALGS